jgi:hypothetical protein
MTGLGYVEAGLGPYVAAGTVGGVVQVMAVPDPIDIGPAEADHAVFLEVVVVLYLVQDTVETAALAGRPGCMVASMEVPVVVAEEDRLAEHYHTALLVVDFHTLEA